ncbi:EAL domain-containing protein [Methylotuvimicrobium sp.]|uniref:EAL domain-containing protein n=1 Tax=Methylotuvimicrobium sp. TaxID=2822413 RepID=UPI003D64CDFC
MMPSIRSLSLEHKISMATFFAALCLVVCIFLLWAFFELVGIKQTASAELVSAAEKISERSVMALSTSRHGPIEHELKSANRLGVIKLACVYDSQGNVFSSLDGSKQCPELHKLEKQHWLQAVARAPIQVNNDTIGLVYLVGDISGMFWEQVHFFRWFIITVLASILLTLILKIQLSRLIVAPVNHLLDTVKKIDAGRNYSFRAKKFADDELGQLVETFNAMIATVQTQNKALIEAKNRYLLLYDDNPTIIFNVEPDGRIISVNKFGARQLIHSDRRLQGDLIFNFVHFDDRTLMEEMFGLCVKDPLRVNKIEVRMVCQDNSIIWVRGAARVIQAQNKMNILLVCEDITEARKLSEQITYQAQHDSLTGLLNRTEFDKQIQQALRSARNSRTEYALCYLDLDQFKVVNDTCGHVAGDELLRQLSVLIKSQIRQDDLFARLGGDEFGILMKGCLLTQAAITCEKIRKAIQEFRFAWEDRTFSIGVSIGIAGINSISGNSTESLKDADAACYAAKEKGRNRVHLFRPNDQELASRQGEMQWVEKIQRGIANHQFRLYGQPIVPIGHNNEGLHFETLIRYQDDAGHIVPPGAFLPAAERYNLAAALDKWVIASLFEWLAMRPGFIDKMSLCSVNLSGLSLSDETMLEYISNRFKQWEIPTDKICFEITETAAIANLSNATRAINALRDRGSLFSLDDFGSGLSSFAYLKNLPVDFLKIDGLFVKDIVDDEVDLAMVRSINEVGHVMGKKTIAEFVENERILKLLSELGVDYAQGYGIGKPVLLKDLRLINLAAKVQ